MQPCEDREVLEIGYSPKRGYPEIFAKGICQLLIMDAYAGYEKVYEYLNYLLIVMPDTDCTTSSLRHLQLLIKIVKFN